jgi:surfactin synthase thioesterase subunit
MYILLKDKPALFLLHFAGGSSYSFQFLKPYLLDEFQVIPLELPGRGSRIKEGLIRDFDEACRDICKQANMRLKSDAFLIYGHSMGAIIGLKLASELEHEGRNPLQLIVSGNSGPKEERGSAKIHLMEKEDFRQALKEMGGMPDEVLLNDELFAYYEPILRADFEVLEKEEPSFEPIKCPIYAVMGTGEKNFDRIGNWKHYTQSCFEYKGFHGDHFFIFEHAAEIAAIIKHCHNKRLKFF